MEVGMRAHQIMTKDVITVTPHTSVLDTAKVMLRCHISGLPVLDDTGALKGGVSEGDFLRRSEIGTRHKRSSWLEFFTGPGPGPASAWHPFENLNEMNRLFDDFDRGFWRSPFRSSVFDVVPFAKSQLAWPTAPAVDVVEKDNAYEITAELPGIDEKNVEVKLKLVNGNLTIKGEKQDEKEEKKKDYYLHERHFGSFERSFGVPEDVDVEKIEAAFKKGVLTVKLPKKPEAIKPEKKIAIKAA
jgi:HSP20 family protein